MVQNGRGTAEQWIKEGKYALNWTRLSCHRFVANRVRLSLFVLAYNLGNFLRRLCLPKAVKHWSLRSVQVKLIKMGGRLVRHSRWLIFQLSEVSVPRRLFQSVGSYRPVIAGAKLREGITTILPRGRALQGVGLSSMRFHHTGMVHGENRIPYWIDRRLTGLAGPDFDATISFGLPFEPEDSQYGKSRLSNGDCPTRAGRALCLTNLYTKVLDESIRLDAKLLS